MKQTKIKPIKGRYQRPNPIQLFPNFEITPKAIKTQESENCTFDSMDNDPKRNIVVLSTSPSNRRNQTTTFTPHYDDRSIPPLLEDELDQTENSFIYLHDPKENDHNKVYTTEQSINGRRFTITNYEYGNLEPSLESQLKAQGEACRLESKKQKRSIPEDE